MAIIFFASPLFQVLGFEYSALSALGSSLWIMLMASKRAMAAPKLSLPLIGNVLGEGFFYGVIPLVISLFSAFFIPNCALFDGLLFYIEIVPFTIAIGTLLGIGIGLGTSNNKWRIAIVVLAWIFWLVQSLLPGYFGPQIFTYGWQYGYFPGLVWDEAMELHQAYWWSRLIMIAAATIPLLIRMPKRSIGQGIVAASIPIVAAGMLIVVFTIVNSETGIIQTAGTIEKELSQEIRVQNVIIHIKPKSLTPDELQFLTFEVGADLDSIRSFYQLPISSSQSINIYLYPSVIELYKYVGTRSASISKPWQNTLHIAKENLSSLEHELVHVMLSSYGKLPFAVSYSTGITEGAAEAIEDTYDGIRTVNELAASIIGFRQARGVSEVLSFSGFASNASSKSYVLAGSFSSYLISTYGSQKYLDLYSTLDYKSLYEKSLEGLESDWLQWLKQYPVGTMEDDSLRTNFYFARRSIIAEPCIRRIGKLMREARVLFHDKKYPEAETIYRTVLSESDRIDALRGLVFCMMRQGKFKEALYAIDMYCGGDESKRVSLHILRGDLLYLTGAYTYGHNEWTAAMDVLLNSEQLLAAYSRWFCLERATDTILATTYLRGIYLDSPVSYLDSILMKIKPNESVHGHEAFFLAAKNYLLARDAESQGKLRQAMTLLQPFDRLRYLSASTETRLFIQILVKRYDRYRQSFGEK